MIHSALQLRSAVSTYLNMLSHNIIRISDPLTCASRTPKTKVMPTLCTPRTIYINALALALAIRECKIFFPSHARKIDVRILSLSCEHACRVRYNIPQPKYPSMALRAPILVMLQ